MIACSAAESSADSPEALEEIVPVQRTVVHQCSQMSPEFTGGHLKP
jgi:hypothetical protein